MAAAPARIAAVWLGQHFFVLLATSHMPPECQGTRMCFAILYKMNVCILLQVEELDPETCGDVAAQLTQVSIWVLS
jgi:hypothetical protein